MEARNYASDWDYQEAVNGPDFLESNSGQDWLKEAAEALATDKTNSPHLRGVGVNQEQLIDRLLKDEDDTGNAGWFLTCFLESALNPRDEEAGIRWDNCQEKIKEWALEEAGELIAPYSQAHGDILAEEGAEL